MRHGHLMHLQRGRRPSRLEQRFLALPRTARPVWRPSGAARSTFVETVTAGSRAVILLLVVLALGGVLDCAGAPPAARSRPTDFIGSSGFNARDGLLASVEALMDAVKCDGMCPSGKYLRTFSLRPALLVGFARTDALLASSGGSVRMEKPAQSLWGCHFRQT